MDDDWVLPAAAGSLLRVHVRPGASRSGVTGLHGGALAVRVGARPADGAANREVLAVLARALRVGAGALELTAGARGRDKRVLVHGLAPDDVRSRLSSLVPV